MKTCVLIPVADKTFKNLPEIKHLCPCALHILSLRMDTGRKFRIGRIVSFTVFSNHIVYGIYPKGDDFARQSCLQIFEGGSECV
jgi:hypothetical protein